LRRKPSRERVSAGQGCVADQKPFLILKKEIRGIPRENQSLENLELNIRKNPPDSQGKISSQEKFVGYANPPALILLTGYYF
jgi:hypothetical protein